MDRPQVKASSLSEGTAEELQQPIGRNLVSIPLDDSDRPLSARVFEQLSDHLVGRLRVVRLVLGEQLLLRGLFIFSLSLPEHRERGVRRPAFVVCLLPSRMPSSFPVASTLRR